MRRAIATLGLVVFALCAFPSRADAYFWWWLDDLSGPSYNGLQLEWQLWCRSEDARLTSAYLSAVSSDLLSDNARYQSALKKAESESESALRLKAAVGSGAAAAASMLKATAAAESKRFADAESAFRAALKDWEVAERQFREGIKADGFPPAERQQSRTVESGDAHTESVGGAGAGFTVSLCSAAPFQRTTRFIAMTYGWAGEHQRQEENISTKAELRLITLGLAFHSVVKPYLTMGAEVGVASFSSTRDPAFQKLYVKPVILDLVPFAFGKQPNLGSPWRHVVHVRGFYTVFPTGFEAQRFTFDDATRSKQYRAEAIPGWGLDFDLTPVIRKWQGKW